MHGVPGLATASHIITAVYIFNFIWNFVSICTYIVSALV